MHSFIEKMIEYGLWYMKNPKLYSYFIHMVLLWVLLDFLMDMFKVDYSGWIGYAVFGIWVFIVFAFMKYIVMAFNGQLDVTPVIAMIVWFAIQAVICQRYYVIFKPELIPYLHKMIGLG